MNVTKLAGFTLTNIKNVEKLLDIQIKIICSENFNRVIYNGNKERDVKIYLYKNGNHFNTITLITAFFGSSYYCKKCDTPLSTDRQKIHRYKKDKKVCELCMKADTTPSLKTKFITPTVIGIVIIRPVSISTNLVHEFSTCYVFYKCNVCNRLCLKENNHKCGYSKCFNCKEVVETTTHKCYMLRKFAKGGRCA